MENEFQKGEIVIYTSEDASISLDTKLENDTIWLTQDMIVKLFDSSKANISEHISHILMMKNVIKIQLFGNSEQFEKKVPETFQGN